LLGFFQTDGVQYESEDSVQSDEYGKDILPHFVDGCLRVVYPDESEAPGNSKQDREYDEHGSIVLDSGLALFVWLLADKARDAKDGNGAEVDCPVEQVSQRKGSDKTKVEWPAGGDAAAQGNRGTTGLTE
jgi:hypothetical protein